MEQRIVKIVLKSSAQYVPTELCDDFRKKTPLVVRTFYTPSHETNQYVYVPYGIGDAYRYAVPIKDVEFQNPTDLEYLRSLKTIYAERIANRKVTLGLGRNILKETFPDYQSIGVTSIGNQPISVRKCCANTKCLFEVKAWISKQQLDNLRFSLQLVKQWLEFLKDCGIGFDYVLDENASFKETSHDGTKNIRELGVNFYPDWKEQVVITKTKEDNWISVKILGNFKKQNAYETYLNYMKFIVLRYIYDSEYFRIPVLAMQIKQALPKESNWQCLLLAHYYDKINPYYALFDSGINQLNQTEPIKLVDPFTTFAKVSETLDKGSMNNTFPVKLISDEKTKELLRTFPKLFIDKKFEIALNHLKQIFNHE